MKRLALIRHGKSSWKTEQLQDFERPLNRRGYRDAPFMAKEFARLEQQPSLLLSSYATRALTTARLFAKAMEYPLEFLQLREGLYEASAAQIENLLSECSDEHDYIAVFGHNPGSCDLINKLCGNVLENLPTCGIAVVTIPIDQWRYLPKYSALQAGELELFLCPKQFDLAPLSPPIAPPISQDEAPDTPSIN